MRLAHHARGEPAQMRTVQQPLRIVIELPGQQPPWIDQMFQHIAIDDAVDAARHLERHRRRLDIAAIHFRDALPGGRRRRLVQLDAEHPGAGVAAQISRPQRPLPAADIENYRCGQRYFFRSSGLAKSG